MPAQRRLAIWQTFICGTIFRKECRIEKFKMKSGKKKREAWRERKNRINDQQTGEMKEKQIMAGKKRTNNNDVKT